MSLLISSPTLAPTSVYQYNETDLDFAIERSSTTEGDPGQPVITGTVVNPDQQTGETAG